MKLKHQVLLGFGDGQPHELREIYNVHSRKIKPEEAARMFKDGSRLSIEERLHRGRMRILVKILADFRFNGWLELVAGTELHRCYVLTEAGKAGLKQVQARHGILPEGADEEVARRLSDPAVTEALAVVREALHKLIGAEWADQETLFALATEELTADQAERGYAYYSKGNKNQLPPGTERLWWGKRLMFGREIGHLCRRIERKVEQGKKFIRWKRKVEEPALKIFQAG